MTIKRLEPGYFASDEDLQDKLIDIIEYLGIEPNNDIVTGYDAEGNFDHYMLVDILGAIYQMLKDHEQRLDALEA